MMDGMGETRFVERLRFFDGQPLFASDLQDIEASDRELRWLHNRSLHQPGIGNGYAVSGRKGDREVTVQPGYALNAEGAEIVLREAQVQQVPPVSAEPDGQPVYFDLTVSYPTDDDLEEAETREGVCLPRGVVRLRERPVFCWVRLRLDANRTLRAVSDVQAMQIQTGMKVVLARAEVLNCRLNADLAIAQRRNARPSRQPVIRCATQAAAWEFWSLPNETILGFKAPVDTSAAGFRVTPCYSARISGERPLLLTLPGNGDDDTNFILLDGPAYIHDPGPKGFVCHIPVFSVVDPLVFVDALTDLASKKWAVTWLGIED
jgi:hypothetical protein